jgi:alcohol dehydrogenase class IV
MALASLYSGIALANAGLGAVHGFAGPIGGMFPAPHGAVCAALLPPVMQANLEALREREPNHPVVNRFKEVAAWLTGDLDAAAEQGIEWLKRKTSDLSIPALNQWGLGEKDIPNVIPKASAASSMKGNPIQLTDQELEMILRDAL